MMSVCRKSNYPTDVSVLIAVLLICRASCIAQTNVTGVVVDAESNAIAGVRCCISGFPQPTGGRIIYSGDRSFVFTDKEGRFSIPLPRRDRLVDLQFDGGLHAAAFLYKVNPADSPLRVVMTEGKVLRGRIVERIKYKWNVVPIPHAEVELQMAQEDFWYQYRQATDSKGEFHFRISEPPSKSPWMLYFAGKRIVIDYAGVTPETVMELEVNVKVRQTKEPNSPADGASPNR